MLDYVQADICAVNNTKKSLWFQARRGTSNKKSFEMCLEKKKIISLVLWDESYLMLSFHGAVNAKNPLRG